MIDAGIILQVDGTVIAGVLILLTIKSVMSGTELKKDAGFVAIPFACSAIVALADDLNLPITMNGSNILLLISVIFAMIGFVYLVVFLKRMTRTNSIEPSDK